MIVADQPLAVADQTILWAFRVQHDTNASLPVQAEHQVQFGLLPFLYDFIAHPDQTSTQAVQPVRMSFDARPHIMQGSRQIGADRQVDRQRAIGSIPYCQSIPGEAEAQIALTVLLWLEGHQWVLVCAALA